MKTTYLGRTDIACAVKRVSYYLVLGRRDLAASAPIRSYIGESDIASSLFSPEETEKIGLSMKLVLLADRRESLSIMDEGDRITGIFICPDIFASYLSRKIAQEIQPVERSPRWE